jgi:hypothetical protein
MPLTPLVSYLNDHVAGSRTALELLDYLIDSQRDVESRAFFTTLRADIAADRQTLEDTIARLGIEPSPIRDAAGWFAERMTRLKLAIDDPGPQRLGCRRSGVSISPRCRRVPRISTREPKRGG